MNLNEIQLKVSGSTSIDQPLELGRSYAVGAEFSISDEGKVSNEDGSYDLVFKAKLVRAQIKTDLGSIKTKDKSSQSVKTRRAILGVKSELLPDMEDDSFYNLIQGGIRHDILNIATNIIKSA